MNQPVVREDGSRRQDVFLEPNSIDDAIESLQLLREDLQKIRTQLADRNRQTKMNWDNDGYKDWRHKAVHARNVKILQISRLQQWMQSQRAQRAAISLGTANPLALLGSLADMVDEIIRDQKVELSSDHADILALSRKVVNENPVGTAI